MWELFVNNLAKHEVVLLPEELEIIQSLFKHKKFRKRQYILQQGEPSRYTHFVIKGLTRTYEVDENGQEHILFFSPEDWWIGDLFSFLTGQPASYNIDCLEDTEVLQITRSDMQRMYQEVPKMNFYFRVLTEKAYIATVRRLYSSLSKTAAERYEEFIQKYPNIEQRVPDLQIASFLGITPQSLSRIRSNSINNRKIKG